jgi:glycosyltransferase involved in cell wall biosynthesis
MFPRLDILIPVYNEESYIEETLQSLCSCVLPNKLNVRLIFSDNASEDNSLKIIMACNLPFKTLVFSQETNIGGRGNWEFLMQQVEGDFFMFLDAHDLISPNYFIEFQYGLLNESENPLAFIGAEIALNESQDSFYLYPKEWQYYFSNNQKLRIWQLIFELRPNTIVHSIFKTSDFFFADLVLSKSYTFDHLITHIGLMKRNVRINSSANYIRRYRKVVGNDFSHEVAPGKFETRVQRVLGNTQKEFDDKFLASDIFYAVKSSSPYGTKILAFCILKLKYSGSRKSKIIFKIFRKSFRTINAWRSQREFKG